MNTSNGPTSSAANARNNSIFRKEGADWVVVYNPKIPKIFDLNLLTSWLHKTVVCCVRFSPDNRLLATGSNKLIQIFEFATGKLHASLTICNDQEDDVYIRSICFSPDSNYIVSGSEDRLIRVKMRCNTLVYLFLFPLCT